MVALLMWFLETVSECRKAVASIGGYPLSDGEHTEDDLSGWSPKRTGGCTPPTPGLPTRRPRGVGSVVFRVFRAPRHPGLADFGAPYSVCTFLCPRFADAGGGRLQAPRSARTQSAGPGR